jgi:hypothetical protein
MGAMRNIIGKCGFLQTSRRDESRGRKLLFGLKKLLGEGLVSSPDWKDISALFFPPRSSSGIRGAKKINSHAKQPENKKSTLSNRDPAMGHLCCHFQPALPRRKYA